MNFQATTALLRDQVGGYTVHLGEGKTVRMPGLKEIVERNVRDPGERELALSELGFILGVASMLGGLSDKGGGAKE